MGSKYKKWSKITLSVVGLLTALCFYFISQLDFDYDFEKFFPQHDEQTDFFKGYRKVFETDNDFVLVALTNEDGIFKEEFLADVVRLSDSLKHLPYAEKVISPTNLKFQLIDPVLGIPSRSLYLHANDPSRYARDSVRIFQTEELVGNSFAKDGKSLAILVKHKEYLSKAGCDTLSYALQDLMANFEFDQVHLAGRSVGQTYYVELMQVELGVFVATSFILVVFFLFVAFRTTWGVVVPLVVVVLSVVWILGFMGVTGKSIDIILTVLPTIMFVVGMSDVVHILSKYIEELRNGSTKIEAIRCTFREVGRATLLTSITTSIGFFTLISSRVIPLMDFGIYVGIGVMLAFVLAFTVLPSTLVLMKEPKIAQQRDRKKLFWNTHIMSLLGWVIRHRNKIWIGAVGVIILSLIGISRIEINNFLLDDLSDDSPLKEDFTFFDENFSGVRPFEMAMILKDSTKGAFDYDVLIQTEKAENYLKELFDLEFCLSPIAVVKSTNRMFHQNNAEYYRIPPTEEAYNKSLAKRISKFTKAKQMRLVVSEDLTMQRLASRMSDIGSAPIRAKKVLWEDFVAQEGLDEYFEFHFTGTAELIDVNNKYLAKNMMYGLLIAFVVIAIIMGLLYRSLIMIAVSLIPNILPLLIIGGLMGFCDINLKVSTSIIFTIIFGIAVDDTIHFMSKLRIELGKGKSLVYAMKRTFLSTGKAIVVTSIILAGGFLTLIFSDFMGTFYVGLLIGLALVLAVISDLLLLPVLLVYFYKYNRLAAKESK